MSDEPTLPVRPPDAVPLQVAPGDADNVIQFKYGEYTWGPGTPSTGGGFFEARYVAAKDLLVVTVRCRFKFFRVRVVRNPPHVNKGFGTHDEIDEGWPDGEADKWKEKFKKSVESFWSLKHIFVCTEKGLEAFRAIPQVRVEVEEGQRPAWTVKVFDTVTDKIAEECKGEENESCVRSRDRHAFLVKENIAQYTACHEAGHMLGLGDEYAPRTGESPTPRHAALVEKEFGIKLVRGKVDPTSIMVGDDNDKSQGRHSVMYWHCVVFLDVLREATGKRGWALLPNVNITPDKPSPPAP